VPSAESVIRRFYELATAGDPACWELWAEDATSVPPEDWPEAKSETGIDAISHAFESWSTVFGERFWAGISLDSTTELPDSRVLAEVAFTFAGDQSGAPIHEQGAVIYTVSDGKIVRGEHFMNRAAAREAAQG
jgi:ketosteroid isomerase-like protein